MFARFFGPRNPQGHERISSQEELNADVSSTNEGSLSQADGATSPSILSSPSSTPINHGVDLDNSAQFPEDYLEPLNDDNERNLHHSSTFENESITNTHVDTSSSSPPEESLNIAIHPRPISHPFLSSQVQAERHIRFRRQSTCVLVLLFLLIRLWIQAMVEKDAGLFVLSVMSTAWTYRWWKARRDQEEEYDRQIMENNVDRLGSTQDNSNTTRGEVPNQGTLGNDPASNFDPDLGIMSFQAQLALAILESQRQMFENGGYGGNDRSNLHLGPGVTDEARAKWKKYEWNGDESTSFGGNEEMMLMNKVVSSSESMSDSKAFRLPTFKMNQLSGGKGSNYGSLSSSPAESEEDNFQGRTLEKSGSTLSTSKLEEGLVLSMNFEEPSCSICLCEYEKGELVISLPCNHIFHDSCLSSWTTNHVRCPLCNYNLMEGFEQPQRQQQPQNPNNGVLFGRMIRARAVSSSSRRRLASVLAAMEDSVV